MGWGMSQRQQERGLWVHLMASQCLEDQARGEVDGVVGWREGPPGFFTLDSNSSNRPGRDGLSHVDSAPMTPKVKASRL